MAKIRCVLDWLVYVLLRIVICVLQAIRIETCEQFCRFLAWLSYRVLKIRRSVIDDNLQHAFPEFCLQRRQAIAIGMWRHVFMLACELAHVPRKIHDTNWRDFVSITDEDSRENIFRMLDERPVILVSGHFGNFEVGGLITALLGFSTYTIARPLDNPFLHRFITKFRGATGQYMLPKQGSARQVQAIIDNNGTIVLLGDQSAGRKGCWVDFFNRPASNHKAVALFSLTNNAPMMLGYTIRDGRPMKFRIGLNGVFDPNEESLNTQELTQWYSDRLESVIRMAPDQYWWLHRRWKDQPPKKKRKGQPKERPQTVRTDAKLDDRGSPHDQPMKPEKKNLS